MHVGRFRVAALFLLSVFTIPALASADTDFSNNSGTLALTSRGTLSLSASTVVAVTSYNRAGLVTGNLDTIAFTTGALATGSADMGGTFDGGGSFSITGPVSWQLVTLANGTHNYMLCGVMSGMMGTTSVNAVTVRLTINTGEGYFDDSTMIAGGDTTLVGSVPEPSTLALLGTGIASMIGMARRKIVS